MKKIIIIGGGAAGAKAASKAKRLEPTNQIELYTDDNNIAYSLCGLPYFIEGSVNNIDKLKIKSKEDFINSGIDVFLQHQAQKIIPEKNCIIINDNHIFYDKLILALGAKVKIPNIKNIEINGIYTLRSLESGVLIKEKMKNSKKVLIIGGGYISIELIEAFTKNELDVIVVEKDKHIANDFDDDFALLIQKLIAKKCNSKITFYLEETIKEFIKDENNKFIGAITNKNTELRADFCVLATGATPNTEIAQNAGIKLGTNNSINVDKRMRTNFPNIFACGDCAEKFCIITRQPTYIGLGTIANKEGRVAAINATSNENYENFDGVLKSVITKFYDNAISKTGLTLKEAEKYAEKITLEPISTTITKKDKASYMPNTKELTIKLIADKRSGELLGMQAIGFTGNVAQRINTITSALKSRLTVEELLHLDLAYAPPFSSSIDPILTALYKLKESIKK